MKRRLGYSDLQVSPICLGSMTWGSQNSEAEGYAQLDLALDMGVDFIDTAEMYPTPRSPKTYGRTEEIIGDWLKSRKCRDRIVLASKVSGPDLTPGLRPGKIRLDRQNIEAAIDQSLKRLNTDYLDLYQLHWPDRKANFFGKLGYGIEEDDQGTVPVAETLGVLDDLVKAGKVRLVGLSNETPWGVMRYLELSRQGKGPRIVSIQNPYSLLNRTFEIGLAEISHREGIGLLAYSSLAMGVLTGKYLNGATPPGARLTLHPGFSRYSNPEAQKATQRYVELAREAGLDPAQMALAYVVSRPFTTAVILGATSVDQLRRDIESRDLTLGDDLLKAIEAIHVAQPNPAP